MSGTDRAAVRQELHDVVQAIIATVRVCVCFAAVRETEGTSMQYLRPTEYGMLPPPE
jgi:hypothetical protein